MFRKDWKKTPMILLYLSLLETFPDSLCFCGFKSKALLFHLLKQLLDTFCGIAGMRTESSLWWEEDKVTVRAHLAAFCWADCKITSPYAALFCKAQYQYPAICACDGGKAGKDCEDCSTKCLLGDTVGAPMSLCPPWPAPLQCRSVLPHEMVQPVSERKRKIKPAIKHSTNFFQFWNGVEARLVRTSAVTVSCPCCHPSTQGVCPSSSIQTDSSSWV